MTDQVSRLNEALKGRYHIQRELGTGGMATVYLARDTRHEREVAIKVLHPDLGAALGSERFLTEIRTTAQLQHPHILPLLDSGEADGLLYYVMPYVTGETLRQRLEKEEQLPIGAAISIAREVADALSAAHEMGIVHRDIKPENILLRGNHAVVSDFGIALAVQQAGGQRMTQTGLSLGTPQYMSPEQAMGERNIGPKSDIYSLGAVTYEMIAGDPPFTGHSVQAIVAKVITEQPTRLSTVRSTVPPHVEDAVLTALSKLPADRFATANEFAFALSDDSRPTTIRKTVTHRPAIYTGTRERFRDPLVLALGAGVVILAAATGMLAMRSTSSHDTAPVTRVAVAFPAAQAIVPQWRGFSVALSNDGSRLAYIGAGPTRNTVQIWVRPLDGLEATPVPGTVGATSVKFAPDDRSILISMENDPEITASGRLVSLDGEKRIEFPGAANGDVGASGQVYSPAADSQAVLIVRQEAGGTRDTLRAPSLLRKLSRGLSVAPTALTVLPDESAVLVSVSGDSLGTYASADIAAVSLSNGKATVIGKGIFARYLSSGHLLYVAATGDIFVAPFDAKALRISGKATVVGRTDFSSNTGKLYPQVTASQNGTMVYLSGEIQDQRLAWLDQDGRLIERLPSVGDFWGVALSPDGSRVALAIKADERTAGMNGRGSGDVFVENVKTGVRTRLTDEGFNVRPSWSLDGQFVLFSRVAARGSGLLERRADASAPERYVLTQPIFKNTIGDGRWLPDHRSLIVRTYASRQTGTRDIFYYSVDGRDTTTTPIAVSRAQEQSPAVSPDATMIAYVSNETGTNEVYVQPIRSQSGRLRVSNGGGNGPRWARGDKLYYLDSRNHIMVASIQSRPTLAVVGVRDIGGDIVPSLSAPSSNLGYDVAPDGRILVTEPVPGSFSVVLVRNWLAEIQK